MPKLPQMPKLPKMPKMKDKIHFIFEAPFK